MCAASDRSIKDRCATNDAVLPMRRFTVGGNIPRLAAGAAGAAWYGRNHFASGGEGTFLRQSANQHLQARLITSHASSISDLLLSVNSLHAWASHRPTDTYVSRTRLAFMADVDLWSAGRCTRISATARQHGDQPEGAAVLRRGGQPPDWQGTGVHDAPSQW
jgi:hypothetical protein